MISKAYFAGGCFWGVEHLFRKKEGVVNTQVGYMGGKRENPSYETVLLGATGHKEAVEVSYDPKKVSFEELAKFFFEIHDPTQKDGQGPDIGEQYLSFVFHQNRKEKEITEKLIRILKKKGFEVATRIEKAGTFWPAEEYHQRYYEKTGKVPYCHFYTKRF